MVWRLAANARQYAILEVLEYDSKGKVASHKRGSGEWEYLIPGSVGGEFLDSGCKVIRALMRGRR
jgi:hypothetical protein